MGKLTLKPGGVFAVIDHRAAEGLTREEADDIHRMTAQNASDDITLAGFEFDPEEDSSDIHSDHPDDDTAAMWDRDPRDATNRFVLRFKKPGN